MKGGTGVSKRSVPRNWVLSDLRSRLVSEQIRPGEQLLSIAQMCEVYGVGRAMIRSVLRELCEEGLIELSERRPGRAVKRPHDAAWKSRWEEEILRDRHNLLTLHVAAAYLLSPILVFAAENCSPRAVPGWRAVTSKNADSTEVVSFFENLLHGSGGVTERLVPLFLAHCAVPYFWEVSEDVRSSWRAAAHLLVRESPNESKLAGKLWTSCSAVRSIVRKLAREANELPPAKPTDTSWELFCGGQLAYERILMDLLVRIGIGGRGATGLLPSEQRLAEHFTVSVSTVRESLFRLEEAQFTRTVNGRGTFVLDHAPAVPAWDMPWFEQLLMQVLQAAQLLALIMPVCAREASGHVSQNDLLRLNDSFKQGGAAAARAMFHFIIRRQTLRPFRMVLARAGAFCDWGIVTALSQNRRRTRRILGQQTKELAEYLQTGNRTEFIQSVSQLYLMLARYLRDDLLDRYGVARARSVYLP